MLFSVSSLKWHKIKELEMGPLCVQIGSILWENAKMKV